MQKKQQKPTRFDPYAHVAEVVLIGLVLITAFFVIWLLYNVSIMQTTDTVIVGPFDTIVQLVKTYFPLSFIQDTWKQQQLVWKVLYEGYRALLKSIGLS